MNEIINTVADFILLSALIPNLIFAVRYYLYSPFERTREGRTLLYEKLALSSLLIVIMLTLLFGNDYFGRPFVRLGVFGAITYFFWAGLVQLILVQRKYPWKRWDRK